MEYRLTVNIPGTIQRAQNLNNNDGINLLRETFPGMPDNVAADLQAQRLDWWEAPGGQLRVEPLPTTQLARINRAWDKGQEATARTLEADLYRNLQPIVDRWTAGLITCGELIDKLIEEAHEPY